MSKQVYLPVCVEEDGSFNIDFDGAPWMYVDTQENVWDEDDETWQFGGLDSDNADVSAAAEERVARANVLLSALERWVRFTATHYEGTELMLAGSGADHASFLYVLIDEVAKIKVDFTPVEDD